jgi:hypothetical protein
MNSLRIYAFWIGNIPLIFGMIWLHILRRSKPSRILDFRSHLKVFVLKIFLQSGPWTVSSLQEYTTRDPGIQEGMSVSICKIPAHNGARDLVLQAVQRLGQKTKKVNLDTVDIEAEWMSSKHNAEAEASAANLEKNKRVEEDHPVTVFYLHGGAFCFMDPSTCRDIVWKIAKRTGGRCFSPRYRLAPTHPFPAALLDVLIAYLVLVYPPEGASHKPANPRFTVIVGDRYVIQLSTVFVRHTD